MEFVYNNRLIKQVDNANHFRHLIDTLRAEYQMGVDLEADSLHHYRDRVCLIQISTREADWLVDPQRCHTLDALWKTFENPDQMKIFHDADFDLRSLNRDFRIKVKNIFDTKIALELLGRSTISLAGVLDEEFGVKLSKKFQRYNWSRRPLTRDAMIYAALDTRYLQSLKSLIEDELVRMNRPDWAREEFEHLERVRWQPSRRDLLTYWRLVNPRSAFHPQLSECLRLLWELRETEAERRDVPVFKIFSDKTLQSLAHLVFTGEQTVPETLPSDVHAVVRKRIPQLIRQAINTPDENCPRPPADLAADDPPYDAQLYNALQKNRNRAAERERIDPALIAGNKTLKRLAELPKSTLISFTKTRQMLAIRSWQWKMLIENGWVTE